MKVSIHATLAGGDIGSQCKCKESKKNKLTEDATDGE